MGQTAEILTNQLVQTNIAGYEHFFQGIDHAELIASLETNTGQSRVSVGLEHLDDPHIDPSVRIKWTCEIIADRDRTLN